MKTALAVAAAALIALTLWSYQRAGDFEHRARAAEQLTADKARENQVLDDQIEHLLNQTNKRDTVIVDQVKEVRVVDQSNPPPDTCRPNLAARDDLIASQAAQIADLKAGAVAVAKARANLQVSNDSLAAALGSRPKGLLRLPFLEIGRPTPAVFIGVVGGQVRTGAGVAIPIRIGGSQ